MEEKNEAQGKHMIVYIGTYTGSGSQGIYVGNLDLETGRLDLTSTAFVESPSYVAVDPQRRRLYAVSEVNEFQGQPGGGVSAFALDPEGGALTPLNSASSGGEAPCHVSVDPAGRFVLVANYGGGSVGLLPLDAEGRLAGAVEVRPHVGASVDPERQSEPHAHFITMDPAGRYALANDLGTDSIEVYEIEDAEGRLALRPHARAAVQAGAGPRHLAFHPSGQYAYLINEMAATLTVWQYDAAQGHLSEIQTLSTLPDDFTGKRSTADVHVHPSGRFVYGSNREHDSLAIFTVEPETGRLSLRDIVSAGGQNPRGFAIDPTGAYLVVAHQDTDTVVIFTIDLVTGDLTPTGSRVSVPSPVCVKLLGRPMPGRNRLPQESGVLPLPQG